MPVIISLLLRFEIGDTLLKPAHALAVLHREVSDLICKFPRHFIAKNQLVETFLYLSNHTVEHFAGLAPVSFHLRNYHRNRFALLLLRVLQLANRGPKLTDVFAELRLMLKYEFYLTLDVFAAHFVSPFLLLNHRSRATGRGRAVTAFPV